MLSKKKITFQVEDHLTESECLQTDMTTLFLFPHLCRDMLSISTIILF